MSNRHRSSDQAPPPRAEFRAHAHNERHRVHSELHLVTEAVRSGTEPLDVVEPGLAWRPDHHHDPDKGVEKSRRPRLRHWKTKAWKRRTAVRKARARAWDELG